MRDRSVHDSLRDKMQEQLKPYILHARQERTITDIASMIPESSQVISKAVTRKVKLDTLLHIAVALGVGWELGINVDNGSHTVYAVVTKNTLKPKPVDGGKPYTILRGGIEDIVSAGIFRYSKSMTCSSLARVTGIREQYINKAKSRYGFVGIEMLIEISHQLKLNYSAKLVYNGRDVVLKTAVK